MERQDNVILDMKKQINQYRQEIIELSTGKKMAFKDKKGSKKEKKQSSKVPRLDLSKVKMDSDDDSSEDGDVNDQNEEKMMDGTMINNQSYNQYLKFLENQSQNNDNEMGEES